MHKKHTSLMYENKCMMVLLLGHLEFLGLELQTAPKEPKGSRKKRKRLP